MIKTIKLPVWEGTYKNPNKGHIKEFNLFFNEKINLIQQSNISKTFYEDNNYSFITSPPGSSKYANKLGDRYISKITNLLKGKKIKNILEIGAGSDYIAKGINKKNPYQLATLVDPALRKSSIKNIKVISSYFPTTEINNKVFDFIYSINTLEHVIDPEEFLMQVRNNITKEGFLVFIFPNIEEQFKRGDIGSLLHEHLNYFDSKSARFLFEKCGFNLIESFTNNDEITLFCEKTKLPSTNIIQFDCVKEKIFYDSFSKMLARVETNKEKFLYYYSKGFKIGFHGACNALSNFLYLSNLYKKKDFYIFDGDESKNNRYLPYSAIKILHNSNELYREMDVLFIAASTFSKEIVNNAKEFFDPKNILNLFD